MKDMGTADVVSPYLKLPLRGIDAVRPMLTRDPKQGDDHVHLSSTGITTESPLAMFRNDTELKAYLEQLAKLGAPDLHAEWAKVYERPAPRRVSRDLLIRGIAYRVQEQMYGGLKPATIKKLKEIAAALREGRDLPQAPKRELHPGARLIREWAGKTHIVEVIPEGFAWSGKTYRSLTEIAHLITGAHRSGPRFFGLRDKRRRPDADAERIAERLK